jgi:hypothetical protein
MTQLGLAVIWWIAGKVRWLFDLIYGGIPAEFESDFNVEESVKRLSAATKEFPIRNRRQFAQGEVSKSFVELSRPYSLFPLAVDFRGGFEPHFKGEFFEVDGRARLSGRFTLGTFPKTFATVWFGGILLWEAVAIRPLLAGELRFWWFPLAGLGLVAFGAAHVWLGKRCSRSDILWLSNLIRDALCGTQSSAGPPGRQTSSQP